MEYCLLVHIFAFETSFLMREELRLRMSENRALKIIFGLIMEEVPGAQNKIHNEKLHVDKLHNFCSSPNTKLVIKSRTVKWYGRVQDTEDRSYSIAAAASLSVHKEENMLHALPRNLDNSLIDVTRLTCIREIPGSNIGRGTD